MAKMEALSLRAAWRSLLVEEIGGCSNLSRDELARSASEHREGSARSRRRQGFAVPQSSPPGGRSTLSSRSRSRSRRGHRKKRAFLRGRRVLRFFRQLEARKHQRAVVFAIGGWI